MLQYLEPGLLVDAASPAQLRDHLRLAMDVLEPSDLALGWQLRPDQIEAVRPVVADDVNLWRWVPMLAHAGAEWASERQLQVGPGGSAPEPFKGMDDFRFLCPSDPRVLEASVDRAVSLAQDIDGDGVLLDRIRWHSPSQAPSAELSCFCGHCWEVASSAGLDLDAIRSELSSSSSSSQGRAQVVRALLGSPGDGQLRDFLAWRQRHMRAVVSRLADAVRRAGLRTALDVFTPGLAFSVGQDLEAFALAGEWTKSMTYFDAVGPATMPYEFGGYARWLAEAGVEGPLGVIEGVLGFAPPGLSGSGPRLDALSVERERLVRAVGADRAVLGLDAVELPGVCEVEDGDLDARLKALQQGGIGVSPSWELLAISPGRIRRIASLL